MEKTLTSEIYKREISAWERMLNWSPFSVVSMVTRVKGKITIEMLRNAVDKVQQRHTLLRVRLELDENQTPWFTSDGISKIPIEIVHRENDDTWIEEYDKACLQPFDFYKSPLIRIYLIQNQDISDIMMFCHHVICDGLSLAFLARDLMEHLGNPELEPEILADPLPLTRKNIPEEHKLSSVISWVLKRINQKWEQEKILFDQMDYLNLHKTYWENFTHRTISIELSEAQTERLVNNCRREGVSVNSAIAAAFIGAQNIVLGQKPHLTKAGIGVSLRKYLQPPIEEEIGFYATVVYPKFKYDLKNGFWDNARAFHKKVTKLYTAKNFFQDSLSFTSLAPSLMEARNYKLLGGLVPSNFSRYDKISSFSKRDDVLLSLLKREKAESVKNFIMGTAVTNLTRMNFPQKYGDLELERLIVHPGAGFPLTTVNLVIAAVTCVNKLSLLVECAEENIDLDSVLNIKEIALELLLEESIEK
jgi:NRPS condensation-like uncharacterized protein